MYTFNSVNSDIHRKKNDGKWGVISPDHSLNKILLFDVIQNGVKALHPSSVCTIPE